MKLRTDFVTNSSSSSFVVAYKELDSNFKENKLHNAIIEMIIKNDSCCETDVAKIISNKKELDDFYVDLYGYQNETIRDIISRYKDVHEEYKKCLHYIDGGYKIMVKSIGYGDYTMEELMRLLADTSSDFILIGDNED